MATNEAEAGATWLLETAKLDLPEEIMEDNATRKVVTRYTPLGVVAAIVPWNFPIQLCKLSFIPRKHEIDVPSPWKNRSSRPNW